MKTPEQIENERLAPAGVPAGATHVCRSCKVYFIERAPGVFHRAHICMNSDLVPIAEAGPAPTTAAPAELPNRREFHVSTPAEFAAAAQVAQGGDAIIVPAEWPRESAPAEQLSGKVVCVVDKEPHDYLRPMLGFGGCRDTAPAEQPGKATDPRPAQPQAPAEPTKEQIEKAGRVLAAVMVAERRGENMDPIIARALAAEAAPLREERDRLAGELAQAKNRDSRHANEIRHEQERWIRAEADRDAERATVAERDARIATLQKALNDAVKLAEAKWDSRASADTVQRGIVNQLRAIQDRVALGAPEGQPPAAPSEAPLDALREALGDATVYALRVGKALRDLIDVVSSDGDEPRRMRHAVSKAVTEGRAALSAPPPPPRELLGKEGGEALRLLHSAVEVVRFYSRPRPGSDGSLAKAWIDAHPTLPAPSSPEEQLSEGATTKKEG